MSVKLGPAGIGGYSTSGIKQLKKLKLEASEIPFTYGVRMGRDTAKIIGNQAKRLRIDLSVHAPYYINLASIEKEKVIASRKRILESCERAHCLGAKYVVFHPGFYQGRNAELVYEEILDSIGKIQKVVDEHDWNVALAPETTGKPAQFGHIDELLRLMKDVKCSICVDFAHLLARHGERDYDEIFGKLKKLDHIHSHFTGIEYSEKGEIRHVLTPKKEIIELLGFVKKYKANITIINESPDPVRCALVMKKIRDS